MMRCFFLLIFCLSVFISGPVQAQTFSLTPLAPLAGPGNVVLSEALLDKLEAVKKQLGAFSPEQLKLPDVNADSSIENITQALAKNPKIMAVLDKNAIKPRDYVMGYMTLVDAFSAAEAEEEEQIFDETHIVSKENLAFGKKYANRIRALLEE